MVADEILRLDEPCRSTVLLHDVEVSPLGERYVQGLAQSARCGN